MIRIGAKLKELFSAKINMGDLKDNTESHFLTRALAALALMMKCGLDVSASSTHITDGYHDMGIDAIYLDESQKQLFLVQSKWRKDGKGTISQEEMHTFVEGIQRIINLDLDGANQNIIAKKPDIEMTLESMGYQIHAIYIHTGNNTLTEYAKRPLDTLFASTNDEVSTLIVFDEIFYKDVYTFLAEGQDSESISLNDVILSNWGKISLPYIAYYGTVSASAVGVWYRDYGNKLFAKNIRFYKGNTDVNDGMRNVLIQKPENFFYYNNGIKLLCKNIQRKIKDSTKNETGLFSLEGVSLVNGAQTTGTIGKVFLENPDQVSKASVMVQIIDLSKASDESAMQITKLSNTQNRIENRDFASLDPLQERIRQDLSFSHFSYLYKSGDKITDPTSQITFDEAIVALACLNQDIAYATLAKRNVGALSDDISKAPYTILFDKDINSFQLLNSVMIVRYVDKELQAKKEALVGRERLVAVHGNRFIAYCTLQKFKSKFDFDKKLIFGEELLDDTKKNIDYLIIPITKVMNELYADSYPANIFKNSTKCKHIYQALHIL